MSFWKRSVDGGEGMQSGMTPRALVATVLCMLLAGMYTQYSMVILGEYYMIPEAAMPIPAFNAILLLLLLVGVFGALFKVRILTKAELVCVMFATVMSVPLMTQGFWHRFIGVTSAPLRNNSFDYIDAYSDTFWPHGPNILADALEAAAGERVQPDGVTWGEVEYEEGESAVLPTISNNAAGDERYISFQIPVTRGDAGSIVPENPHLVSFLAHTVDDEAETEIICRAFVDDSPAPTKLVSGRRADKKTYLHKKGFVRMGIYGVMLGENCQSNVTLQIGIRGRGSLTIADPKLMSVHALETAFRGRKMIKESDYNALPPEERPAGVVVKPDNMWSLKGLTFIIKGYIPLREWLGPAAVWGSYLLFLCTAFFCMNTMMRRKWADSERYPMPNTRIPLAMIGVGDEEDRPFAAIWRNKYAWAGLVFALVFGYLKGGSYYNPRIPDPHLFFYANHYISNPVFGGMFNVLCEFSLFICTVAIFFELNVLLSIVVGFWIARSFYFIGHVTKLDMYSGFPWFEQQMVGTYIGYFLVILFLSRKYIWGIIADAFKGKERDRGEPMSARVALVLFILCHFGVAGWAVYTGSSVLSMLLLFCFLVAVGFIAAKYRAECGTPFCYFTPYNAMLFVGACGGMAVFGSRGMLASLILSGFLTVTVFYLIPGMQFEAIEIGRRMRIKPRHIIYTCLLGLAGGLFIGGWVFLSNAYTYGGDNIKFQWAFNGLNWYLQSYRTTLGNATSEWLNESAQVATGGGADWGTRMMGISGGIMVILAVLRQFFSGFWFHPIGFLLGFTHLNDGANWGSLLAAWAIKALVLKLGGARAVRNGLYPFFVGSFIGCIITVMTFTVSNGVLAAIGSQLFYPYYP